MLVQVPCRQIEAAMPQLASFTEDECIAVMLRQKECKLGGPPDADHRHQIVRVEQLDIVDSKSKEKSATNHGTEAKPATNQGTKTKPASRSGSAANQRTIFTCESNHGLDHRFDGLVKFVNANGDSIEELLGPKKGFYHITLEMQRDMPTTDLVINMEKVEAAEKRNINNQAKNGQLFVESWGTNEASPTVFKFDSFDAEVVIYGLTFWPDANDLKTFKRDKRTWSGPNRIIKDTSGIRHLIERSYVVNDHQSLISLQLSALPGVPGPRALLPAPPSTSALIETPAQLEGVPTAAVHTGTYTRQH